jgi:hypothetical protein
MTLRSFSANAARNGSAWTLAPIAPPGRSRWLARSPLRRALGGAACRGSDALGPRCRAPRTPGPRPRAARPFRLPRAPASCLKGAVRGGCGGCAASVARRWRLSRRSRAAWGWRLCGQPILGSPSCSAALSCVEPGLVMPVRLVTSSGRPRRRVPPPASRRPSRAISPASSGGVSSSVSAIARRISSIGARIA